MYYYTLLVVLLLATPFTTLATNQVAFDINEAYTQLMYSYSAYCPQAVIGSWTCTFCTYNSSDTGGFVVSYFVYNTGAGLFTFIGHRGNTVEVVFRGSANIANWIENIDVFQVDYPGVSGAEVHQGFYDDYTELNPVLKTTVLSVVSSTPGITRVVFTGHSLGGALATHAAIDIGPSLPAGVSWLLYTFGSPRVGNQAFANHVNAVVPTSYRITFESDIVPHILTELAGYWHVAQEVWWSKTNKYRICSATTGEDDNCSDSVLLPISTSEHTDYLGIELNQGNC